MCESLGTISSLNHENLLLLSRRKVMKLQKAAPGSADSFPQNCPETPCSQPDTQWKGSPEIRGSTQQTGESQPPTYVRMCLRIKRNRRATHTTWTRSRVQHQFRAKTQIPGAPDLAVLLLPLTAGSGSSQAPWTHSFGWRIRTCPRLVHSSLKVISGSITS